MEMSSTVPMTAWQSGRFRAARAGSRKLLFGCMYEDAEIELRAFQPGGRIFCVASAGCTADETRRSALSGGCRHESGSARLFATAYRRWLSSPWQRRTRSSLRACARAYRRVEQNEHCEYSSILMIRNNKSFIGDGIWIRGDFVLPFLLSSHASFLARFTPLHFLMFCRRISELYCALEWSGASRCIPTARIRTHMPCFSEICLLRGALLKPHKFNFDAPTRRIFSNASQRGALLDFLFQTFSMEQIWRTRSDYSRRCNMLLHPGLQ